MSQCLTLQLALNRIPSPPGLLIEETKTCVEKKKSGKAPGADGNPAELYDNDTSTEELHHVLERTFKTEVPPGELLGQMLNFFAQSKRVSH